MCQLLYWVIKQPSNLTLYSALNLINLGSKSTWILHIFYPKHLLHAVFHLHLCIHLSILSHFFRTAFSLNLADAILWLQASSSHPAHLSLLSLSLNYYSISPSHFTCNFRNCLFKASLSHPSSSNHNQKAESCLWSFCGVRLLCPCFTFSDRCHQTFYHFHSWEDLFVSISRADYLQRYGWKKHPLLWCLQKYTTVRGCCAYWYHLMVSLCSSCVCACS